MWRVRVPDLSLASFIGRGLVPEVAGERWLLTFFGTSIFYKECLQLKVDCCGPSVDSSWNGGLEALCKAFLPTAQVLCLQADDGNFMPGFLIEYRPAAETSPGVSNNAF